jgi:hypothetical protein
VFDDIRAKYGITDDERSVKIGVATSGWWMGRIGLLCPHQMLAVVEATLLELRRSRPYWGPRRLVFELAKRQLVPVPSESAAYRAPLRAG